MSDASSAAASAAATFGVPSSPVPRAGWHPATVAATRRETSSAARIELEVDGWPGNAAGQHLDIRLTAEDGYTASRSYSIASSGDGTRVVLAVDRVPDGEVSPFLVDVLRAGDRFEVHGPLGAFFVWRPRAAGGDARPVQLIAGGSGVVPLVAMARAHADADDPTPFRLLYAARTPEDVYFAAELDELARSSAPLRLDFVYSRRAPDGASAPPGRITRERLAEATIPPGDRPIVYVCGSTGFVELVASWLIELGHDSRDIRTERFGGT
ncbi:ferredoxin reductase [Agromyces sp. SYSU T0242]|uniref:ferredoxin reductase n=1 Tax=Agromyces litoreus TaxID=3158561 RepID=UPI003393DA75